MINAISGSTRRLRGSICCCQYFCTLTETSKDFLLQPHSSIHNNLFCPFKLYHAHPHTHTLMVQFGIQYLAFRLVDDSFIFLSNMHPASTCILLTNKLCRMYRASCQKEAGQAMFDRYIITKDTIWQISVFLGKVHTRTSSNATEQSLSFYITSCLPLLSYLSLSQCEVISLFCSWTFS